MRRLFSMIATLLMVASALPAATMMAAPSASHSRGIERAAGVDLSAPMIAPSQQITDTEDMSMNGASVVVTEDETMRTIAISGNGRLTVRIEVSDDHMMSDDMGDMSDEDDMTEDEDEDSDADVDASAEMTDTAEMTATTGIDATTEMTDTAEMTDTTDMSDDGSGMNIPGVEITENAGSRVVRVNSQGHIHVAIDIEPMSSMDDMDSEEMDSESMDSDVESSETMTDTESSTVATPEVAGSETMTDTESSAVATPEVAGSETMTDTESSAVATPEVAGSETMTDTESVVEETDEGAMDAVITDPLGEGMGSVIEFSDLEGMDVINNEGETLGSLDDLLINLEDGSIVLATLAFGGFLGLGEQNIPVPLSELQWNPELFTFVWDIPAANFEELTAFEDGWPDLTADWTTEATSTWDFLGLTSDPDLGNLGSGQLIMAEKLVDMGVENSTGDDLGGLDDLVINWQSGQVLYAVMGTGGFLGLGESNFAVPLSSITFSSVEDDYVAMVDVTEEELSTAPVYEGGIDFSAPDWDAPLRSFWGMDIDADLDVDADSGEASASVDVDDADESDADDDDMHDMSGEGMPMGVNVSEEDGMKVITLVMEGPFQILIQVSNHGEMGETEVGSMDDTTDEEATDDDSAEVDMGAMGSVNIGQDDMGDFLTDAEGRTLYTFSGSDDGMTDAEGWEAVEAGEEDTVGEGLDDSMLGTVDREDGTSQLTYNGYPLYRYSGDAASGDTGGQGMDESWWMLGSDGEPIE